MLVFAFSSGNYRSTSRFPYLCFYVSCLSVCIARYGVFVDHMGVDGGKSVNLFGFFLLDFGSSHLSLYVDGDEWWCPPVRF